MRQGTPDRAESIRHRLRNRVRERGEDVQYALQRYAVERFLYRLGRSPHRDRFILKDAMLFGLWGGSIYRPTRDLDLTGYGSSEPASIIGALRDVCGAMLRDGVEYHDLGSQHFAHRDKDQVTKRLIQRLRDRGVVVEVKAA